jgi:hypothetical protein
MHTIRLEMGDSVYAHIMFLLKNLKSEELKVIEEKDESQEKIKSLKNEETIAFSNHTANLIEDWQTSSEDSVWK